jgi:hypothetical protein
LISTIITKGAEANTLKVEDPHKAAELLIDALEGLRFAAFSGRKNFFPDKNQFYSLLKREKEFVAIFFKGLSS